MGKNAFHSYNGNNSKTTATTTTTVTAVCAWEKPVFFMPLANSRNTKDDSDPLSL
jgi:hypothetical protein